MEKDINSNKTVARPAHNAVDTSLHDGKLTNRTEQQRMDQTAMKAAKRAENRIVSNDQKTPDSSMFTK